MFVCVCVFVTRRWGGWAETQPETFVLTKPSLFLLAACRYKGGVGGYHVELKRTVVRNPLSGAPPAALVRPVHHSATRVQKFVGEDALRCACDRN